MAQRPDPFGKVSPLLCRQARIAARKSGRHDRDRPAVRANSPSLGKPVTESVDLTSRAPGPSTKSCSLPAGPCQSSSDGRAGTAASSNASSTTSLPTSPSSASPLRGPCCRDMKACHGRQADREMPAATSTMGGDHCARQGRRRRRPWRRSSPADGFESGRTTASPLPRRGAAPRRSPRPAAVRTRRAGLTELQSTHLAAGKPDAGCHLPAVQSLSANSSASRPTSHRDLPQPAAPTARSAVVTACFPARRC